MVWAQAAWSPLAGGWQGNLRHYRYCTVTHRRSRPACKAPKRSFLLVRLSQTAPRVRCGAAEHTLLNNRNPIGWFACLRRDLHVWGTIQGAGLLLFITSFYGCKCFSA